MNKNTFIHDQFNTWKKCKKRYYLKYIKELNLPELQVDFKLGKSVHALINYRLKGFDVDFLVEKADLNIKNVWELIKTDSEIQELLKNKLIVTEWGFNSRIGETNNWLVGRIDAVFYDEVAKKYIIADWKTGKFIPKNTDDNFQHIVYLYAFYNAHKDLGLDIKPDDLVFQYVKIRDDVEINSIPYSEEQYLQDEKLLEKCVKEIEIEKDFNPAEPCGIKGCRYRALCK